jgi:hypothetical protein
LLRPRLEGYYEVQTGVPVGDLPRQADIVLLRRTGTGALPFQGLWRWLTTWNILEFKGPTVMPRERDLPLLVELGLGIDRRLNAERVRQRQRPLQETDVSFRYIANKLGPRLLGVAERRLGPLESGGPGVWRSSVLGYPCLFVSTVDLPVDEDSFPLHVLGIEPREKERQLGFFIAEDQSRLDAYSGVFSALHPKIWEEVKAMAKRKREKLVFDFRPWVEDLVLAGLIEQIGQKRVIEEIGEKQFLKQIGKKRVLEELDVDDILVNLPAAKRRELQRRLAAEGSSQH